MPPKRSNKAKTDLEDTPRSEDLQDARLHGLSTTSPDVNLASDSDKPHSPTAAQFSDLESFIKLSFEDVKCSLNKVISQQGNISESLNCLETQQKEIIQSLEFTKKKETDNNRRLHIGIQCMLDEEIPETSEAFRKLKQLCMRLLQVDWENCNKASDIFDTLEEKRRIGIGQYGELKKMLSSCKLEAVVKQIEVMEKKFLPTWRTEGGAISGTQLTDIFRIITRSIVIGNWKELARNLKIGERDIIAIEADNHLQLYERCHQVLLKWQQISGASVNLQQLIDALIYTGHQALTDDINEYLRGNSR